MADLQLNTHCSSAPDVHKFGGSSLKDAAQIARVIATIEQRVNNGDFVVVSANGQVTDYLCAFTQGQNQALGDLSDYLERLVASVLQSPTDLTNKIKADLQYIQGWSDQALRSVHEVLALGELWSAQLLSAKLTELKVANKCLDARDYLVVNEQNLLVNTALASQQLLQAAHGSDADKDGATYNIITGFIARDTVGHSITLGRNGSDYTATLIAHLVQSNTVYLWTDVDGVYTADPNVIEQARGIAQLSTCEAQALSELGSNVLHPKAIAPILQQNTRLVINRCGSKTAGTLVERLDRSASKMNQASSKGQVKTLAHKNNLVMFHSCQVQPAAAQQLLTELAAAQVSYYASQYDKTQQTLSFLVESQALFQTTQLIKAAGLSAAKQASGISLISVVGHGIRQNQILISQVLQQSTRHAVQRIHYPDNEHSLCILLADDQAEQLLNDLHDTFFAPAAALPVVLLGHGNIGQQFIEILRANKTAIEASCGQPLSLVAVANSRFYQFSRQCLLGQEITLNQPNQQGELLQQLQMYAGQPTIIIDVTASAWVSAQYLDFAKQGWHIISANKIAAADSAYADKVEQILLENRRRWLKNTTVGAALPIQQAIKKVQQGGDRIRSVTGVFSGSLSWLFGHYDGQVEFMEWVKQAHQAAYTEPDPRADLSGQDVYRKALILARELGVEPKQIHFKPVLPAEYLQGTIDDFWQNQSAINSYIKNLWLSARQQLQRLRYLATVSATQLRVELVAVDQDHAAAGLKPGDNIFIIESDWYNDNPLVIQGPGAGREVTAAGVLTDLIEVLQSN